MTIAQSIAEVVESLSPDKQREALAFIRQLGQNRPHAWLSPEGIAANAGFDMSLEEFQTLRREMWGLSTERETP